ncbi:MAG TPA: hemolysin family protein [Tenuifilaceae bacterium]|nr:hemolysin family protein [Tenuifilaceae bacterium]HPI44649.1 hemolysin family protein [Tenuifilaceae bacterium]HPN20977.1 hemolysin family protein [Tenuifilaceae bacterium]
MGASIAIIITSLIFSAFFSGMEIAFVSANRLRLELDRKHGQISSGLISIFTSNPSQYIATMLVGNNIALVVYGIEMAKLLTPSFEIYFDSPSTILLLQTLLSTIIILITAEFLPKSIFRLHSNALLNSFAFPVFIFYLLFYPVSKFSTGLSYGIIRVLFRIKISRDKTKPIFGKIDLDHLVGQAAPSTTETRKHEQALKIFQNALDFSEVKIRDCMIPRTDIEAIEIEESIDALKQKFIETKYSRIPVFKDTVDNIIGYINSKELFKNPESIQSKLIKIDFIPETMKANKVLAMFIKEHKSIAVVVDEFGGTAGLVTIEDIIEEIIGEIDDEHDRNEFVEKQINENEFIFSGRLEIKHLNETYNLKIPESDEYETLAGFVLFQYQNIPKPNEIIILSDFTVRVLRMNETRIELIQLTKQ